MDWSVVSGQLSCSDSNDHDDAEYDHYYQVDGQHDLLETMSLHTHRHTDTDTHRQRYTQTDRQTHRRTHRHRYTQTDTQTQRYT